MRTKERLFANLDLPLLLAVLAIMFLGIITVYSVTFNPTEPSIFTFGEKYGKQMLWVGISLFVGLLLLLIDADIYRKFAEFIYGGGIILLIIVLFMPPVHGAHAWLGIGGLGIQPAEFAKISTALLLAKTIDQMNLKLQNNRTVLTLLIILILPGALVALQPDAGTLLVFSSFLFVLYREGISFDSLILNIVNRFRVVRFNTTWLGTHFIPFLIFILIISTISLYLSASTVGFLGASISGIVVLSIIITFLGFIILLLILILGYPRYRKNNLIILISAFTFVLILIQSISFIFNHLAKPHQKNRIELVLGLKDDPNGTDYNRNRAMAAVGSGGFYGKGFLQASVSSVRANHVPESETDFIFCPFSEEWGFIGSLVLITLYLFIILRIFTIAERQRSTFFRIYAYGVGMIFFYHVAINIGMNIGLAPVIGIPLPFMSYGGSSILAFTAMVFILLKLDSQRKDVLR